MPEGTQAPQTVECRGCGRVALVVCATCRPPEHLTDAIEEACGLAGGALEMIEFVRWRAERQRDERRRAYLRPVT